MFRNIKITSSMHLIIHSVIGFLIGGAAAGLTAAGQAALNTGSNLHVVVGVGIAAMLTSLFHSFVPFPSSPVVKQAESEIEQELHLSPALISQLEPIVKIWLAPYLAGELMKIRTPPVSALKTQPQPVPQPPQQAQQSIYGGGGSYPNVPLDSRTADQSVAWNLASGQYQQPAGWPQASQAGQGYPAGHGG